MSKTTLPSLPRLPRARGLHVPCLCGCGRLCGTRFAPGHDAKLLAWTLLVEKGVIAEAPAPHTAAVKAELALRVKAKLTGEAHTKALLQRSVKVSSKVA